MDERRSSTRSRTILGGIILSPEITRPIGCTVLDISASGARILLDAECAIPAEFTLEIPKRETARSARVIWSSGRSHGIEFLPDSVPARALDGYDVRKVVEDARKRIAEIVGIAPERINVDVRIDS
jgi:hypothetical protein